MAGRFAPSPSGPLHVGNLRTALVAWLAARSEGEPFYVRVEDLDPVTSSRAHERGQLGDLSDLGLDWDEPTIRQSERFEIYRKAIDTLDRHGLVYPCFCSRREIREEIERASQAPQIECTGQDAVVLSRPDGAYPGTCRDLPHADRVRRGEQRLPALRVRTDGKRFSVADRIAGAFEGVADDMVLARADQVPAYNLAVVVDDRLQNITQVVRGDDLLSSTPRHLALYELFDWEPPEYWHVPLVMDGDARLAKRSGGVTSRELYNDGWTPDRLVGAMAASIGLASKGETVSASALVDRFDPLVLNRAPVDVLDLLGA